MKRHIRIGLSALLLLLSAHLVSSAGVQQSVLSQTQTVYPVGVNVVLNLSNIASRNHLSMGVQFADEANSIISSSELESDFAACSFSMVRISLGQWWGPCRSWNETRHTGTYDWKLFDETVNLINNGGCKLLICANRPPAGMPLQDTGFPDPSSFSAYVRDIAVHMKESGWTSAVWEVWNEPYEVFGWSNINETRMMAYIDLFNNVSESIHEILPTALVGSSACSDKLFLKKFTNFGRDVGFLGFHMYNAFGTWLCNTAGYYDNQTVLIRATQGNVGDSNYVNPERMKEIWYATRNETLPIFCTETNLNGEFMNGTDPRQQDIIGAVWYAEELRGFILEGVSRSIYYQFASDDSPDWNTTKQTKGFGFGMVRSTVPFTKWYPYYFNYLLANRLSEDDPLYETSSDKPDTVSVIAWSHNSRLEILLICKVPESVVIYTNGISGNFTMLKIDSTNTGIAAMKYESNSLTVNGYCVVLLEKAGQGE